MKHPTWEVPYGDCCEGLRVWNDAGCNCPDTKTVLSHDVTFAHYAKLAATFTPVCQVDVSSFQCEESPEFLGALPLGAAQTTPTRTRLHTNEFERRPRA